MTSLFSFLFLFFSLIRSLFFFFLLSYVLFLVLCVLPLGDLTEGDFGYIARHRRQNPLHIRNLHHSALLTQPLMDSYSPMSSQCHGLAAPALKGGVYFLLHDSPVPVACLL